MTSEILKRYAAVVPVLVDAGCEAPPNTYMDLHNVPEVSIAVLEQWFHQTVVPWVHATFEWAFYPPKYDDNFESWCWSIGSPFMENSKDPTKANIQCLEELAEVIGASNE